MTRRPPHPLRSRSRCPSTVRGGRAARSPIRSGSGSRCRGLRLRSAVPSVARRRRDRCGTDRRAGRGEVWRRTRRPAMRSIGRSSAMPTTARRQSPERVSSPARRWDGRRASGLGAAATSDRSRTRRSSRGRARSRCTPALPRDRSRARSGPRSDTKNRRRAAGDCLTAKRLARAAHRRASDRRCLPVERRGTRPRRTRTT